MVGRVKRVSEAARSQWQIEALQWRQTTDTSENWVRLRKSTPVTFPDVDAFMRLLELVNGPLVIGGNMAPDDDRVKVADVDVARVVANWVRRDRESLYVEGLAQPAGLPTTASWVIVFGRDHVEVTVKRGDGVGEGIGATLRDSIERTTRPHRKALGPGTRILEPFTLDESTRHELEAAARRKARWTSIISGGISGVVTAAIGIAIWLLTGAPPTL